MKQYLLTGIDKATFSDDRKHFEIVLQTLDGPILLEIVAGHLEQLITHLADVETAASLLEPTSGAAQGESIHRRGAIVSSHEVGRNVVGGTPSVIVGMHYSNVKKYFALDGKLAVSLRDKLTEEIPKLQKPARPN